MATVYSYVMFQDYSRALIQRSGGAGALSNNPLPSVLLWPRIVGMGFKISWAGHSAPLWTDRRNNCCCWSFRFAQKTQQSHASKVASRQTAKLQSPNSSKRPESFPHQATFEAAVSNKIKEQCFRFMELSLHSHQAQIQGWIVDGLLWAVTERFI